MVAALHATTLASVSPGAALVGLAAVALAAPVVAAAFIEEPPLAPVARTAIVLAACWCVAFGVAAVHVAFTSAALGVVGLLAAGSCLGGAAAVWFTRSRPRRARTLSVPESYWARWESQLRRERD
jgi:hypothetical protein